MSMKMKGLLKGLRYISTIFDEEEEAEMQIGLPTDVKHVAHIGWDGPTANSPSWINQFKDGDSGGGGGGGAPPNVDQHRTRDPQFPVNEKRVSTGSDPPLDSPSRRRSSKTKGSRRASSASTSATDSPRRSSTTSTSSETKTKQLPPTGQEGDPNTAGSKTSTRRKKPKSSSSGGASSSRTSNKSKSSSQSVDSTQYSDHSSTGRRMKGKDCQSSVLKTSSEQSDQKPLDDISRGIQAM